MALIHGEDYEVLPNGVVNLKPSAVEKLWEMGTPLPTKEEDDEFIENAFSMVRGLGFNV